MAKGKGKKKRSGNPANNQQRKSAGKSSGQNSRNKNHNPNPNQNKGNKKKNSNKNSRKGAPKNEFFLTRFFRSIVDFMKGVRSELSKVTWLERDELVKYTVAVIVLCAIMTLFVWGFDTIFGFLKGIIG